MELDTYEEGVSAYFDYFSQIAFRVDSAYHKACLLQLSLIGGIEFIAVPVSLGDLLFSIDRFGQASRLERAGICSQTHRSAFEDGLLLVFHKVYHRMACFRVHLRTVGVSPSEHVAGILDDCHLHTEADSEERNAVLAGIPDCLYLAFEAPAAEARRHEDAVHPAQLLGYVRRVEMLAVHRMHVDLAVVRRTGVNEGLEDGLVRVLEFHIFTDQGDVHLVGMVEHTLQVIVPGRQVGSGQVEPEMPYYYVVQSLLVHIDRNLVDALGVD